MTQSISEQGHSMFAVAVAQQLRDSRIRQRLTQTQLAARTGGRVSKAALANYETRQRSLRVDVFWVLARALGEDPASILAAAERESGHGFAAGSASITIDIQALRSSDDVRLAPVRRWFALRLAGAPGIGNADSVTLDDMAINALAQLMGTPVSDCRNLLRGFAQVHESQAGRVAAS